MLSGPDEYDIALTLTSLYRQNMSGLLTVYHVDGVDALQMSFNSPFKAAERLADKIAEPVQLVIGSYLLGNVFQLRLPGNFKPREDYVTSHILESLETPPEGMWFPAYNHGYDEETWKEAGRIVTRQEIWNDALLSGAPNRKPLHILDFDIMCSLDDAKKRMLELQGKTRNQVVALFNDAILCAVSPCLKAERHAQRVGVYAKALNRFSGGSWVRSRSSRLQIL